jgi:hypothetical protein
MDPKRPIAANFEMIGVFGSVNNYAYSNVGIFKN